MNELNSNFQKKFDLEERTAKFAETVIDMVKKIPFTPINNRLIEQIVGSSGSIGANYSEEKHKEGLRKIWQEAQELLLIFSKIISSSRKRIEI